jgi:peptidoglycan/LPS O-acetylase OafA/YrhL
MTSSPTAAVSRTSRRHQLPHLPALDGLRGAAVAVVLAFHAQWLTGGYLGVDVFFVLSGFLITRLLFDEYHSSARIRLIGFWKRRARRLLPALLALVFVAAVAERMRDRLDGPVGGRRDVIGALTYTSNWLRLGSGAGYWSHFTSPAILNHTWSLAIEEQFYVVWPLLVLGLLRLVRSDFGRFLILGVASFGLGLWALRVFETTSDASRVYMGTDTRAVALLLGATVAAFAFWRPLRLGSGAGHVVSVPALLVLAILMVRMRGDALFTYRGGLLACSVAGAVVVAAAAVERPSPVFRVFTAAPMQWLGQRSYGIYLWHWPIMVGLGVAESPRSPTWRRLAAVAISLVAAEVSYRYLEQPIRKNGLRAFRHASHTVALAFGTLALCLVAVSLPTPRSPTVAAPIPPAAAAGTRLAAVATAAVPGGSTEEVSDTTEAVSAAPTSSAGPQPSTSTVAPAPGTTSPAPETVPPAPPLPRRALPVGRRPRVMYVGDSVGWFLAKQATSERLRLGVEVVNGAHTQCPLSDTPLRRRRDASSVPLVFPAVCDDVVRNFRNTVAAVHPDVVIMVFGASLLDENEIAPGQWFPPCSAELDGWFQDQIRRSVDALSSTGATVYWATQAYYRAEMDDRIPLLDDQIDCENERAREVVAQSNGAMGVLELGQWACPSRDCLTERDGFELRPDGTHFLNQGASLANIWMLSQIFDPPPWEPPKP